MIIGGIPGKLSIHCIIADPGSSRKTLAAALTPKFPPGMTTEGWEVQHVVSGPADAPACESGQPFRARDLSMKATALVLCLLVALARHGSAEGIVFHVAPDGNDAWSGRVAAANASGADGPFRTPARARLVVRQFRHQCPQMAPVTVLLHGVFRLDQPLVFTPDDSGTQQCPVTWTSPPGQRAVLSGGRPITGWRNAGNGLWQAEVPDVRAGKLYFRQLFVGGRRATRARSPHNGYYRAEALVNPKPGGWNQRVDKFRFFGQDIRRWADLNNVEVVVVHSWNTSRVRISSVDPENRVVTFTGPTIFRPLAWDPQQRYYVENAAELLDSPGEWYLDAQHGVVSYRPLPGEDPATAEFIAPALNQLLRIDGDPDSGTLVEHLNLVNLVLEHADWSLGPKGYGDPQAAVTIPAAVSARGACHCRLEGCEVRHVGYYGVWFSRGCKDNQIVGNHIHDLGAGAMRLGEADMPPDDRTTSSGNLISNNYLHDGGIVYAGAVGLWLAHASDNEVSHNEIHSFNYSGMSLGWNWSDTPTRTFRNRIEWNHVHHVVRGMLSDAGGIYTLGRQTGTVIRHNVFHDIFPYIGAPAMAWGIYFDQDSNGLVAEDNVVYNTLTGGIMNTGSHGNVIRNNVFALSAWQAAWRWTNLKPPGSIVEGNIFYLTQGELFGADAGKDDRRSRWDRNFYWRTDGRALEFYDEPFSEWQAKGSDQNGSLADPAFVDPAHHNFRLRPDSPALKLGIRSIDTGRVGLFGSPEWVALPKTTTFPPTVLPLPAAPLAPQPIDDDFETTAPGQWPQHAKVIEEGLGDSIRIVDDGHAASGRRSLLVVDAPGLKHNFNPHFYFSPHFRQATARLNFDVRLERGAIAAHEWRDAANPYRVGPAILFRDGQLFVHAKPLTDVPLDQWFHVEIICGLGTVAMGRYELRLGRPGHLPQLFPLSCESPKFNRLEWLGFASLATEKTEFRLDNVKLDVANQPPAGPAGR
jgi:hypothetical protein